MNLGEEHMNLVKHKKIETVKNNRTEMKNTIMEMKNTSDGINIRLDETEGQTSDLEDKLVENAQPE